MANNSRAVIGSKCAAAYSNLLRQASDLVHQTGFLVEALLDLLLALVVLLKLSLVFRVCHRQSLQHQIVFLGIVFECLLGRYGRTLLLMELLVRVDDRYRNQLLHVARKVKKLAVEVQQALVDVALHLLGWRQGNRFC